MNKQSSNSIYRRVTSVGVLSIALLGSVVLSGCAKDPISTERSNNSQIEVELLFEKDGVKLYRFTDEGRYIYYTDARGRTEWTTAHGNGKTTTTRKHQVETAE
jgi:hypothetical protein